MESSEDLQTPGPRFHVAVMNCLAVKCTHLGGAMCALVHPSPHYSLSIPNSEAVSAHVHLSKKRRTFHCTLATLKEGLENDRWEGLMVILILFSLC